MEVPSPGGEARSIDEEIDALRKRISDASIALGVALRAWGLAAGKSASTVSKFVRGESSTIEFATLLRLADAQGLDRGWLVSGAPGTRPLRVDPKTAHERKAALRELREREDAAKRDKELGPVESPAMLTAAEQRGPVYGAPSTRPSNGQASPPRDPQPKSGAAKKRRRI